MKFKYVKIHSQSKKKWAIAVVMQSDANALLNEIVDTTSELPLECQDWVLIIVKAMLFTRSCLVKQLDQNIGQNATA